MQLLRCYDIVGSRTITLSILLMPKTSMHCYAFLLFYRIVVTTFVASELRNAVQDVMDKALCGNDTSRYELEFRTKIELGQIFTCECNDKTRCKK